MIKCFFMRFVVFFVLPLVLTTPIVAGPFGLEMGMSLAKLKEITGSDPIKKGNELYIMTPPKPHKLFETYVVKVSQETGLYFIKALSKDVETSSYGTELKETFLRLVSKIEKTYGKYKLDDYLKHGSIWNEPKDFMMGMIKKERFLMAFWDKKEASTLTEDLVGIAIGAYPLNSTKGYISLEYSFKNREEAEKKLADQEDSVF